MPEPISVTGVTRLWRTLAIGLTIGITAHLLFYRQAITAAPPQPMTVRGDPLGTSDSRLDAILDALDFDKTQFAYALQSLADRAGLNMVVNWQALLSKGISQSDLVSLHLKHVTFASALDAVLLVADHNHSISWNEFGGIVFLATHETADQNHLPVRVYDVARILDHGRSAFSKPFADCNATEASARTDDLIKLITDTVLTDTWKANGGAWGSITSYNGTLIISHTVQAHRMIEALLQKLDRGV